MLDLYIYIYIHQFFVAILAQDFKAIFACFRDLAFFSVHHLGCNGYFRTCARFYGIQW